MKVQVIHFTVITEYIVKTPQNTSNSSLIPIHTENKTLKLWGYICPVKYLLLNKVSLTV